MSTGPLFMVNSSVKGAYEREWNQWYTAEHLAEVANASDSIVRAERFQRRYGTAGSEYLAQYEFLNRDGLERFLRSYEVAAMASDFGRRWGAVSEFEWAAYLPVLGSEGPAPRSRQRL